VQEITIRQAVPEDLEDVAELEKKCFPLSEAADRRALELRLGTFPECFWVLSSEGRIISMINGMTAGLPDLTDAMYSDAGMYDREGEWLMLFGVATAPGCRRSGCASRLMTRVTEDAKSRGCKGIVLTCKEELMPFYQRFGFVSEGRSSSSHGGAQWYQMRLTFRDELLRCAEKGEEYSFYRCGRRYLLYGWGQCDGVYLNVADEDGNIVWQTTARDRRTCSERFAEEYM